MAARRTKFYLDRRNAKWLGVCSGIADYLGVDPLWVRIAVVLLTIFTLGPLALLVYLLVAWLADNKPAELYDDPEDEKAFWKDVRTAPSRTIRSVHGRFRDIDRRLRDIETHVTSTNRGLAAEIEKLR